MTSSDSAEQAVRRALACFRSSLDRHLQVVDLSEGGEARIHSAVEWLLATRSADGFWGYRSPAVTATCATAVARWRPTEATTVLNRSARWLLDEAVDDQWETVWDSAAAVTAIWCTDVRRDRRARRAAERLRALDPTTCAGRPHHCAQVLAAAHACEWAATDRAPWTRRIHDDLDVRSGCYVIGQAVFGLLSAGRPVAEVTEALDHLAHYLTDTPLSTATFLDHTASLRALAVAGTHPELVDRTIDDMFTSAFRRDGSWYHEPWYTSWALLALHEASSVRRVVVEQPRLNDYLAHAETSVVTVRHIELHRSKAEFKMRRQVVAYTVLLGLGLGAS